MAFAVAASKGAPLAGLLKNILLLAAPSSSALRLASVATTRRLFSTAMASAVAGSKGAPLAGLLKNILLAAPSCSSFSSSALRPASVVAAAAARRLFGTSGSGAVGFSREGTMGDEEFLRYHGVPGTISTMVDEEEFPMVDEEFLRYHGGVAGTTGSTPGTTGPAFSTEACCGWVSKQDEDVLEVKMEMPEMAAEHVKVWTSPKLGLLVRAEDPAQAQDPYRVWYSGRIVPPTDDFALDKAQAEMKDGVLTVTVPKVKVDPAGGKKIAEIKVRNG